MWFQVQAHAPPQTFILQKGTTWKRHKNSCLESFRIFDWTICGQILDVHVQHLYNCFWAGRGLETQAWQVVQELDRVLSWLDRDWTEPVLWQILDKHWIDMTKRLDFLSSLCPTNHRQRAPISDWEYSLVHRKAFYGVLNRRVNFDQVLVTLILCI